MNKFLFFFTRHYFCIHWASGLKNIDKRRTSDLVWSNLYIHVLLWKYLVFFLTLSLTSSVPNSLKIGEGDFADWERWPSTKSANRSTTMCIVQVKLTGKGLSLLAWWMQTNNLGTLISGPSWCVAIHSFLSFSVFALFQTKDFDIWCDPCILWKVVKHLKSIDTTKKYMVRLLLPLVCIHLDIAGAKSLKTGEE